MITTGYSIASSLVIKLNHFSFFGVTVDRVCSIGMVAAGCTSFPTGISTGSFFIVDFFTGALQF